MNFVTLLFKQLISLINLYHFSLLYLLINTCFTFCIINTLYYQIALAILSIDILYLLIKCHNSTDYAFSLLDQKSPLVTRLCLVCKKMKPDRFYHCAKCNQCRWRMDHHCLWIGNCIAGFNTKLYINLISSALIFFVIVLITLISRIQKILNKEIDTIYIWIGSILGLGAALTIFQLFRLLKDQYYAIQSNQTLIQSYKLTRGIPVKLHQHFFDIFSRNPLNWIFPIDIKMHGNILQKSFYTNQSDTDILRQHMQYRVNNIEQLKKYDF